MALAPATSETFAKFLSSTDSRDKLYRIGQYGSRFLAWYLSRGAVPSPSVKTFAIVESRLGEGRKCLRLAKFVNELQKYFTLKEKDPRVRLLLSLRHWAVAHYFLRDNLTYLSKIGLMDDPKGRSRHAGFAWMFALTMHYLADGVLLQRCNKEEEALVRSFPNGFATPDHLTKYREIRAKIFALHLSYVKNVADFFVAFNNSRKTAAFSPGFTGFCGIISSLIGVYQVWPRVQTPPTKTK